MRLDQRGLPDPGGAGGFAVGLAVDGVDQLVGEINHCAAPLVDELCGVAR